MSKSVDDSQKTAGGGSQKNSAGSSFIKGAAILGLAAIVIKILGAFLESHSETLLAVRG